MKTIAKEDSTMNVWILTYDYDDGDLDISAHSTLKQAQSAAWDRIAEREGLSLPYLKRKYSGKEKSVDDALSDYTGIMQINECLLA